MPPRLGTIVRRRSWGMVTALAVVVACSGNDDSFFDAPPVHANGGKAGGTSAKAGHGGSGGSAGAAVGKAGGPTSGDAGGAGDGSAGAGEAGMPATGGSGGSSAQGGSTATGGSTASGGAGAGAGGATATGGSAGAEVGGTAGNGGIGTAGGGASAGASSGFGGIGATAGLGGASAGMGGSPTCVPTVPSTEICDGIDNDCHDGIDGPGVCPEGCIGATYDDHRYLLCSGIGNYTYTRTEAHDACQSHGDDLDTTFDLVRVNSADENAFVLGLIDAQGVTDPVWNAASDSSMASVDSTEGTWVWGSSGNGVTFYRYGSPVSNRYNDWAEGQPDNDGSGSGEDCAVFDPAKNWHWDDVSCSDETSTFVCEEPH